MLPVLLPDCCQAHPFDPVPGPPRSRDACALRFESQTRTRPALDRALDGRCDATAITRDLEGLVPSLPGMLKWKCLAAIDRPVSPQSTFRVHVVLAILSPVLRA
jgi:hypothetical protein